MWGPPMADGAKLNGAATATQAGAMPWRVAPISNATNPAMHLRMAARMARVIMAGDLRCEGWERA